jgi:cytochrome c oxidase assembly factor CtaG
MSPIVLLWKWDGLAVVATLAAAALYAAVHRARLGPHAAYFAAALAIFVLALASPIGTLADGYLFSAHMLQHLLLVLIVPPLALLGLRERAGREGREGRASPGGARSLVVAWGMGVGAMWLWHAPTLCNAAAQSEAVHRVQELTLVLMGLAFWWPVLSPVRAARVAPLAGMVYLFTACLSCTILGILVTFSPVEVCSVYVQPVDRLGILPTLRGGWGLTPARDQQIGGLLMWVPACFVYLSAILAMLGRFYREDHAPEGAQGGQAG